MKNLSIKIFLFLLVSSILYSFAKFSLNKENTITSYLRSLIPYEVRYNIKSLLFSKDLEIQELKFQNKAHEDYISRLKLKIEENEKTIKSSIISRDLLITYLINNEINFEDKKFLDLISKTSTNSLYNLFETSSYKFRIYKKRQEKINFNQNIKLVNYYDFSFLGSAKNLHAKSSAYIDFIKTNNENAILLTSADGIFFKIYNEEEEIHKSDYLNALSIPSNIRKYINYDELTLPSVYGIKGTIIDDNFFYVSYTDFKSDTCVGISILRAELNYDYLNFKKYFSNDECVDKNNKQGYFNAHMSGGRMVVDESANLLLTTGTFKNNPIAQDDSSMFGKIILINKTKNKYQIISKGHRNPQGLDYDITRKILFSSEHGPDGGDELNFLYFKEFDDKINFGWPIASYGLSTRGIQIANEPLYKSHIDHGFREPILNFTPSIAISQIQVNGDYVYVSSMGSLSDEGDLTLYLYKFDELENEVELIDKHLFNERIRDIEFNGNLDVLSLYLESSSELVFLF